MNGPIATERKDYGQDRLDRGDLPDHPTDLLERWIDAARAAGQEEANAMALATVAADGTPECRIVLLRGLDRAGLVFYSNRASAKGRALALHPHAAATFWWGPLERQVRVTGPVARVPDAESDAYFESRPRESQLSAWASPQSEEIDGPGELEERVRAVELRFPPGEPVPRPPFWGGYRLRPHRIEFWQGRPSRRHDRLVYAMVGAEWRIRRLAP